MEHLCFSDDTYTAGVILPLYIAGVLYAWKSHFLMFKIRVLWDVTLSLGIFRHFKVL